MKKRHTVILLLACAVMGCARSMAQSTARAAAPDSGAATIGLWDNWFVQAGLDMSLQNPYGCNFSNVFPNGKSFGVDVAVGKWFTPVMGLRGKLNWENGIGLFRNDHAAWLAPFDEPGRNMDKGGYLALTGDILFSIHSLFWGYDEERFWTMSLFPRAGIDYNFGVSKGSPLLGIGIDNTFRLNDKVAIYFDVAYNAVSSGHVGSAGRTGQNANSNGYFLIDAGVQLQLGQSDAISVSDTPLGEGWFAQAGLDMSLQNPYGCNFLSGVFPNGKTFGIEGAVGRRFTPVIALRGKLDWENGLFKNDHLTWMTPVDNPGENYRKGGFMLLSADVMLNLHNIVCGVVEGRRWNALVYPRAGVIRQLAMSSNSPVLGLGLENSYRLNDKLSLYLDADYQVSTSDALYGMTGMNVSTGSNGFFGLHAGVQIEL